MSRYSIKELWREYYGDKTEVRDYAGRIMMKSAIGNHNSRFEPTIDHVRPTSQGGRDIKENLTICNWEKNEEKGDHFPHWKENGQRFKCIRKKEKRSGYEIVADQ